MFTRQHYEKVALIVGGLTALYEREKIAKLFIEMFKENNPRFDEKKFLKACNLIP